MSVAVCISGYACPAQGQTTANRVWLLQSGASAGFHPENVGSLDLSKLTTVSFAAMRLEIGSWQVVFRPKLTFACCTELLFMIVHTVQLLQHQVSQTCKFIYAHITNALVV